ncbi:MAG: MmcQ/YjbR family DNA-binding protein [Pseudomonadota bacterium]|nr:MmcQ/YjbR family DNA-binding protein [Pseudomonadota bacterium]
MSSAKQPKNISQAVREICLSLPATAEVTSHGSPDFRVEGKTFATYMINHHGDGHLALWLRMPTGSQEYYTQSDPERFYVPPYVGPKGWLGVDLDKGLSWNTIAELVQTAYAEVAPKALALDLPPPIRIDPPTETIDPEEFEPFVASKAQEHLLIIENFCLALPETVRPANLAVCAFVQVKRISAPCTFAASGCV